MKTAIIELLFAALLASSAAAAPFNPVIEPRDAAPKPQAYDSGPHVDGYALRSDWKRDSEPQAAKAPQPEGYIKRDGPHVDGYALRSSW